MRFDHSHHNRRPEHSEGQLAPVTSWKVGARLSGIIPPLITPLIEDRLDVDGLERLIEYLIASEVDGVFVMGTTGEAASLSREMRRELVQRTVNKVAGRAPVLAGITDNSVATTVAFGRDAAEAGADALVLSTPSYLPLEQGELSGFVELVAGQVDRPMFLYNIPQLTRTWFETGTVRRLADNKRIVGLKDSSGDLSYFARMRQETSNREDWSLLVGAEALMVEAMEAGADGCVGGGGNIWPQLLVDLYRAAAAKDGTATAHHRRRLQLLHGVFADGDCAASSIRCLKCAAEVLGLCSGELARPFRGCSTDQRRQIAAVLDAAGLPPHAPHGLSGRHGNSRDGALQTRV
jgi:dihydrodipicolinate synthase/N-acetylneuraminate lyase